MSYTKSPCRSQLVAKKIAPSLNRFASSIAPPQSGIDVVASLPALLRAYQATTGRTIAYRPARSGSAEPVEPLWSAEVRAGSKSIGQLVVSREEPGSVRRRAKQPETPKGGNSPALPAPARKLAAAIGDVLSELLETRHALWQREAELAAQVPFSPHGEEAAQLAARLESVLRAGAEAVGCEAAALYLLDDRTEYLKLRSLWGLPFDRLLALPRALHGAVADLEAMLGHAVVLEDASESLSWQPPEDFAAAVCLPVSSPTSLFGTVWFFSNRSRDFSSRETNMLEVAAGRLAVELEREMLLAHALETAAWRHHLEAAQRLQHSQLPGVPPMVDHWQLAGWAHQSHRVGGAFYDWFCLPDGRIGFAMGRAAGCTKEGGWDASLTAANVRTALRTHGQYQNSPHDVLRQANMTLWTSSAGDQHAAAVFGTLRSREERIQYSSAGNVAIWHVGPKADDPPIATAPALGESPESAFQTMERTVRAGEILVWHSPSLRAADRNNRTTPRADRVLALLRKNRHLSAAALAELLGRTLCANGQPAADSALIVAKRTDEP